MRLSIVISGVVLAAAVLAADSPSVRAQSPPPSTPAPVMVEVKEGDTLSKIATEHQTTYPRVFDANPGIVHPDIINAGQQLRIPRSDEQLESRPLPVVEVYTPPPASTAYRNTQPRRSVQQAAPSAGANASGEVWDRLAQCESGGNWNINTGNGYSGGLQFSQSSWQAVGGSGLASQASREEQIARAQQLQARQGWGAWPACTSKLGIR